MFGRIVSVVCCFNVECYPGIHCIFDNSDAKNYLSHIQTVPMFENKFQEKKGLKLPN